MQYPPAGDADQKHGGHGPKSSWQVTRSLPIFSRMAVFPGMAMPLVLVPAYDLCLSSTPEVERFPQASLPVAL